MTSLGIRTHYDRLDDYTPAADDRELVLARSQLARMQAEFDRDALSAQGQLSWDLFEEQIERRIANDTATEFREALSQVARIAELRLQALLP